MAKITELNKIYNEDCIIGMQEIKDKTVDLILSDPPYGVLSLDWDTKPDLEKMWNEYNRIIKDNGMIVLTATMKFGIELINSNKQYFRYELIWQKSMLVGFLNSKNQPLRSHELILVFCKNKGTYNPQGLTKKKKYVETKKVNQDGCYKIKHKEEMSVNEYTNYPLSILKFSNGNNHTIHPTQKPLDLFKYLILTYSNPNDIVLDSYMGSGTTAIACIETERNFIGFEKGLEYFEKANKRIEENKWLQVGL